MQKDGPYVGFQSVDFGVKSDTCISVGEDGLLFGECVFRQSYSFLYFWSHLAYGVVVKHKYLKEPTCFILSPLQRMLHTGMGRGKAERTILFSITNGAVLGRFLTVLVHIESVYW